MTPTIETETDQPGSVQPQQNPPFGQPNPDAFGQRCYYCRRKATQWKWLSRRDDIWIWVCKRHLKAKSEAA
jgi:hypothetical protein